MQRLLSFPHSFDQKLVTHLIFDKSHPLFGLKSDLSQALNAFEWNKCNPKETLAARILEMKMHVEGKLLCNYRYQDIYEVLCYWIIAENQNKQKKPFEQARSQQHKKDHHQRIVALSFSEWGQGDIWSSTFYLIATAMTNLQSVWVFWIVTWCQRSQKNKHINCIFCMVASIYMEEIAKPGEGAGPDQIVTVFSPECIRCQRKNSGNTDTANSQASNLPSSPMSQFCLRQEAANGNKRLIKEMGKKHWNCCYLSNWRSKVLTGRKKKLKEHFKVLSSSFFNPTNQQECIGMCGFTQQMQQ